ncbi:MAG: protein kinase [Candidatus Binatia bacterium]
MGRVIAGKYEELELLGTGSQGVVYKVQHLEFKTVLALKTFPSFLLGNTELRTRFEQEARMLTRLRHQNIVRVVGSGRDEELGFHFTVMEYIQGKTLAQLLRERGPFPLPEVLEIARQLASALDYAHRQSPPIVHRDIKPSNIIIEQPSGRPVMLDFGIAKRVGENEVTQADAMLGTWKYSSPEQLRHEPLTGSADVYALGMVMYEMYTGTQFFAGFSEPEVLAKVLSDTSEHQPYFSRPTPPAFVALVTKAIAKSRTKRYRSMVELANDLEACWWALDDTKTVMLSSLPDPPSSFQQSQPQLDELANRLHQTESEDQTLTAIKAHVQEVRERAEQHNARQWAAELFARALAREDEAEAYSRNQQYSLAREAYEDVVTLFFQASVEAEASKFVQQAEKIRQEAEIAKADAERYGAAEHAGTQYQQAVTLFAQAETLVSEKAYERAVAVYEESRNAFEDARDLAYRETLREEAEVAQRQARDAKERAREDEAETVAVAMFLDGIANEQQAAAAFTQHEFAGARQLYEAARQKYEQARRQARSEQRQQAAAAAAEVRAVQQELQLSPEQDALPSYRQAVETHRQAEVHMTAHEYRAAKQSFVHARAQYEECVRELQRVQQRKECEETRLNAERAQAVAEHAEAQAYALEQWQATLAIMQDACRHEEQGEPVRAAVLYRQAAQQFALVEEAATKQKARETADRACQQMQKEKPLSDTLLQWAQERWTDAQQKEQEATQAYQAGEYERAARTYLLAAQGYQHAREAADQERAAEAALLQQATQARTDAFTTQREAEAEDAPRRVPTLYQRACTLLTQAEEQWQQAAYQQTLQGYAEAQSLFDEAREAAQRQRHKEAAETAQAQAQTAREAASSAKAETFASSEFHEAHSSETQAGQALQNDEFQQAQRLYEAASQHYAQAQWQASQAQERQRANAAAQLANAAQQRVAEVGAGEETHLRYHNALEMQRRAAQLMTAGRYLDAVDAYTRAHAEYEQLALELERERQERERAAREEEQRRLRAQESREQTMQAHRAAEQAEAVQYAYKLYVQALQKMQEGEGCFEARDWERAATHFTAACELFHHAQQKALGEKEQQSVKAARDHARAVYDQAFERRVAKLFPERFSEAAKLFFDAELAMQQEDMAGAEQSFAHCARLFQQMNDDVASEVDDAPTRIAERHMRETDAQQEDAPTKVAVFPEIKGEDEAADVADDAPTRIVVPPSDSEDAPTVVLMPSRDTPPRSPASLDSTHATSDQFALAPQQSTQNFPSIHTEEATVVRVKSRSLPEPDKVPTGEEQVSPPVASVTPRYERPTAKAAPLRSPSRTPGRTPSWSLKRTLLGVVSLVLLLVCYFFFFRSAGQSISPGQTDGSLTSSLSEVQVGPENTPSDKGSRSPAAEGAFPSSEGSDPVSGEWGLAAEQPTLSSKLQVTNVAPDPESEVLIKEGKVQTFAFTVTSPTPDPLQYAWFIDEQKVSSATGNTLTYRPDFAEGEAEKVKTVRVHVSCCTDQTLEQTWQVRVENVNQPPKILRTSPTTTKVSVAADTTQEFSIKAEDPDDGDSLTYAWILDGKEMRGDDTSQFQSSFTEGSHKVEVRVSDSAGASIRQNWNVVVQAPDRNALNEREARKWFDDYRSCWESLRPRKKASCLELIGVMSRQQVAEVEANLERRREFRVSLRDVEIRPNGAKAVISFRRIQTYDGGEMPPRRVRLEIEKQRSGRIVLNKEE